MVRWRRINFLYSHYVRNFDDENVIKIEGTDTNKPLKETMQGNSGIEMHRISTPRSQECLLEENSSLAGIRYLSPETLSWLPIGLTRLLQVQISEDHEEYWKSTYEDLVDANKKREILPDRLIENFGLMVNLVLYTDFPPIQNNSDPIDEHAILDNTKLLANYLGFPTLEGFAKVLCSEDIKMDGTIRPGRKIRRLGPADSREYYTQETGDDRCSNLGAILWHYETEVCSLTMRTRIQHIRSEIGDLFDCEADEVYGLLNDFRNDSLHGRKHDRLEYGLLLNFISLLAWDVIYPTISTK